jgi:hypothetical protein
VLDCPTGCYADQFGTRAFPVLLRASPDMTVDACAQLADSANYAVFGLQYASECFAGVRGACLTAPAGRPCVCRLAFTLRRRRLTVVLCCSRPPPCAPGKNETLATRYGPSTACNMACHGTDPTGSCGGPLANSVYRLPEKPPSPPPAPVPGQFWTYRG